MSEPSHAIVRELPLACITPDPDQPRKSFDPATLHELAASIRENGLLQPITVRQAGPDRYVVVAGERRFRAHQLLAAPSIRALVTAPATVAEVRVQQIIENDQRENVSPLEQARSYQELMDAAGWSVEDLARRIGKPSHRIRERTVLLCLRPDYQALLASGNLKPSEATELSRLSERGQDTLFRAIRRGQCATYNDLRAAANALVAAEAQSSLVAEPPPISASDHRAARAFETRVEQLAALLCESIRDNQMVCVRKANPHRAGPLADLLAAMQKDLRRIEVSLRETAIQAELLSA